MYLIIRKSDNAVIGTNYTRPPDSAHDPKLFEVKFWNGPEPPIHNPDDPESPVESYDPTIGLAPNDPRLISADDRIKELQQEITNLTSRIEALEASANP